MSPHCVRHLNSLEHNLPSRGVTKVQTFPQYARGYRRNLYRYYPLRSKTDSGGFKIRSKAKSLLLFLPFLRETNTCRARIELSHGNKRNKGNLHPPLRSRFCYFCPFCGTISISCGKFLLSHGNKRNQGNLHPPLRSSFCYFCHFCGTLLSHADRTFIVPQSSALPLRLSKNYGYE